MRKCKGIQSNIRLWKRMSMPILLALALMPPLGAQDAPPAAVSLSLSTAVDLAIKNNLRTLLAGQRVVESEGTSGILRSALLPNIAASSYQASITANLAAMGLPVQDLRGFPVFVGPYNRFDARISAVQSVFDLGAIRRFQAGKTGVALAEEDKNLAIQQVTAASIVSYLSVLECEQSLSAAQADLRLAERLLALAASQRDAGVATGVDVARAETSLAGQRVRLAEAGTALDTARLNLLRLIGLPLSTELTLDDRMRFEPQAVPDTDRAIEQALADRSEMKMADHQVRIAALQVKASKAEWLPKVHAFGDYGSSGLKPNEISLPTRSVGVQLNLPLFDGGRIRSEVKVAASRLAQAEMQRDDLKAAVAKEVRQAIVVLKTREEQVLAAMKAEELATRELELAQDRFQNGVGDNIEVLHAQTALEEARQTYISSLAHFNVARLSLAVSMGHPERFRL
ncbi:MAG: TolC family protein [Acidobacteriota bacterium]|nr:TolC family protein [Acidobacteriota bacterium]